MSTSILFSDTPEHFYQQLKECIEQTIQKELSVIKKEDPVVYIKKTEVCKLLQVSKPTVDSHVKFGYYKKYNVGSRVFYNKQEILSHLNKGPKI